MKFRTEIAISQIPSITSSSKILMIGSCFTENMNAKLQSYKLPIVYNPFGITYNPLSIADQITSIYTNRKPKIDVLEEKPYPFAHHGSFRKETLQETHYAIDQAWNRAQKMASSINTCIITLGSAYAWIRDQKVVNNCHKRPRSEFTRKLLSVDTIATHLKKALQLIPQNCSILLTVSPVRHIRDGLVENNISKSTLRLAIHELEKHIPRVHYFPSFEIMMDDLRDYRFYEDDLLHPSSMAIDYIWQQFQNHVLSEELEERFHSFDQLHKRLAHRPLHPKSPQFAQFVVKTKYIMTSLQEKYPDLDWSKEKEALSELTKLSP